MRNIFMDDLMLLDFSILYLFKESDLTDKIWNAPFIDLLLIHSSHPFVQGLGRPT